ncbi:MAG TPA: type II toxin-antitoxin system HicB family antitoxin [Candidatus Paceibacterota bacterium]
MSRLQKFIEKQLLLAEYKYDESVNQWVGWLPRFRGVYSQGKNIEVVRSELAEILEEQIFLSVKDRKPVRGFSLRLPVNA